MKSEVRHVEFYSNKRRRHNFSVGLIYPYQWLTEHCHHALYPVGARGRLFVPLSNRGSR